MNKLSLRFLPAVLLLAAMLSSPSAQAADQASRATPARAQIGETDADFGPVFTFRGKRYANQKAFIDSGARCSTSSPMETLRCT